MASPARFEGYTLLVQYMHHQNLILLEANKLISVSAKN